MKKNLVFEEFYLRVKELRKFIVGYKEGRIFTNIKIIGNISVMEISYF
jgi:hypothetical protein